MTAAAKAKSLPSILYHYFPHPLPYLPTLALQEKIHALQLSSRSQSHSQSQSRLQRDLNHKEFLHDHNDSERIPAHKEYLLLLQHRPVFTAGRRQTEEETRAEGERVRELGADFVGTKRGGQLTYHGPGQVVGYPLLDLSRSATGETISVREYVCMLHRALSSHLVAQHGITPFSPSSPGEAAPVGIFLDGGFTKLASIGVQVRHRLTTHGFAMNVTREPLAWFDQIVACGLADVRAGCVEGRSQSQVQSGVNVQNEIPGLVQALGKELGREIVKMDPEQEGEVGKAIMELDRKARTMEPWHTKPLLS